MKKINAKYMSIIAIIRTMFLAACGIPDSTGTTTIEDVKIVQTYQNTSGSTFGEGSSYWCTVVETKEGYRVEMGNRGKFGEVGEIIKVEVRRGYTGQKFMRNGVRAINFR